MKLNKILIFLLLLNTPIISNAIDYCDQLKLVHKGMYLGDAFIALGPPHTFGQPPRIDFAALIEQSQAKELQPQDNPLETPAQQRERRIDLMKKDPILGAFLRAKPSEKNVVIWEYAEGKAQIALQVSGTTVTSVRSNLSCSK